MVPENDTSSPAPGERPAAELASDPGPVLITTPDRCPAREVLDAKLEVLVNQRRRVAIQVLTGAAGNRLPLDRLAKAVAGVEYDKPLSDVTRSEWKRVYIAFLQNHLPKMVDAGVAEYDDGEKVVSLTRRGIESAEDLATLASDPGLGNAANARAPALLVGVVVGYVLAYVSSGIGPWVAGLGMAGIIAIGGYAIARSWRNRPARTG